MHPGVLWETTAIYSQSFILCLPPLFLLVIMSISDGISVVCEAWDCLYQPVADGIQILRSLPLKASELTREAGALGALKDDITARIRHLLDSDEHLEQSNRASSWLGLVEALLDSNANFSNRFEVRPSNCMGFGCCNNYKLAKEAVDLLEQARGLKEQGNNLSDDQLINQVPEMVFVIKNLEENIKLLSMEMHMLRSLREDMDARVKFLVSQRQGTERSRKARDWFQEMESIIKSFSKTSEEYSANARSGSFGCSKTSSSASSSSYCCSAPEACDSCIRGFKLGKEVIRLLGDGGRLREQGNSFTDDQLVAAAPSASSEEIPIYFEVVGQQRQLDEVLRLVDGAGGNNMVGISGMGGSGKTTLLKRVNNHYCSIDACGFDMVLYATAGRDCSVARMQKEIAKRLGITLSERGDEEDHAKQIFRSLRSKKSFLLLLNDLWEEIDLERLGIPPLNSDLQKMVITSRDKSVCSRMGVKEKCLIEMGMLSREESWQVFCKCVGNEELLQDPQIKPLAMEVARECGRLPLALVTVGKAMAGVTTAEEWRNARSELRESAHRFEGMADKLLSQLKFSFEKLENKAMCEIMFFCHDIIRNDKMRISGIARRVLAEGLLDGVCHNLNLPSALDMAETLIIKLVNSGLLMWSGRKKARVILHDSVNDMLEWILDNEGDKRPWILRWPSSLDDFSNTEELQLFFRRWEHAKRIDMNGSQVKEIPEETEIPACSSLLTLSWYRGKIVRLPEDFLYHMPSMRILSFFNSNICELPSSVGSLANLKLLDLAKTSITRLPIEIGDLQQLRELNLYKTSKLVGIPSASISRLRKLELLISTFSAFQWTWDNNGDGNNDPDHGRKNISLQDLHELTLSGVLTDITLSWKFSNIADINKLAESPMLLRSINSLELKNTCEDSLDVSEQIAFIISKMERLQYLWLVNLVPSKTTSYLKGPGISYSLPVLRELEVAHCPGIFNLEWVWRTPRLQELRVFNCKNLDSVFASEGENVLENTKGRTLPHLRKLHFANCHKLNCISKSPLLFPSLEKLVVKGCPELRNLCFSEQSAAKIRKIHGSEEWWNNLEWESERIKSILHHCYFQLAE